MVADLCCCTTAPRQATGNTERSDVIPARTIARPLCIRISPCWGLSFCCATAPRQAQGKDKRSAVNPIFPLPPHHFYKIIRIFVATNLIIQLKPRYSASVLNGIVNQMHNVSDLKNLLKANKPTGDYRFND